MYSCIDIYLSTVLFCSLSIFSHTYSFSIYVFSVTPKPSLILGASAPKTPLLGGAAPQTPR